MDEKILGFGLTIPGLGVIKCPECKQKKRRKYFKVVDESALAHNDELKAKEPENEEPKKETDEIEESKYEDK